MDVKVPFNNKTVELKPFKFKHINELHHQKDSLSSNIKFLESFILTPGLNVIEKFTSLLALRTECINGSVTLNRDGRNVKVGLQYILQSFSELKDIRTIVTHENFEFTFDYPSMFRINSDTLLSVLRKIKLDDRVIELDSLSDADFGQIISRLPPACLSVILAFVDKNKDSLTFSISTGRGKTPIEIDFTDITSSMFIVHLFNCVTSANYREYLFVLSKRIHDMNFLLNCTLYEIEDYLALYKKECAQAGS